MQCSIINCCYPKIPKEGNTSFNCVYVSPQYMQGKRGWHSYAAGVFIHHSQCFGFFQIVFQRIKSANNIFLGDFSLAVGIIQYYISLKLQVHQMLTALLYDLYWGHIIKIIRTDQNGRGRMKTGMKFYIFINSFLLHQCKSATLCKY